MQALQGLVRHAYLRVNQCSPAQLALSYVHLLDKTYFWINMLKMALLISLIDRLIQVSFS